MNGDLNPGPWAPAPPPARPPLPEAREGDRARKAGWAAGTAAGFLAGAVTATVIAVLVSVVVVDSRLAPEAPEYGQPVPPARPTAAWTVQDVLAGVAPGTVSVTVVGDGVSSGTGMIVSADGEIATNAHVVAGADTIGVRLHDGTFHGAEIVGTVADHDVALIRIDAAGLTPVTFADSSNVEVGEPVVAVGNAQGLKGPPSVTAGIVSAVNRDVYFPDAPSLTGLIQTDAPINHGNSGGPLADSRGEVIGMNTAIVGGGQSLGFAVPSDTVLASLDLIRSGKADTSPRNPARQGWLGVASETSPAGGAEIVAVMSDSPAERAGLQPGDTVTAVDGTEVTGSEQLGDAIRGMRPGDTVTLTLSDGTDLTVELGRR